MKFCIVLWQYVYEALWLGGVDGVSETTQNYTIRDYILFTIRWLLLDLYVKMSFMSFIIRDGI